MRAATLEPVSSKSSPSGQQNRRGIHRTSAFLSLMYSGMNGEQMLIGDGMVTNLSERGIGIHGNRLVKPEMDLSLFLDVPGSEEPICIVHSRVLWVSGRRFGVELLKINREEHNRLRVFLLGKAA